MRQALIALIILSASLHLGCAHKVQVEPIEINMNIKIEHEIKVKVEKDLEEVFAEDSGLF